MISAKILSLAGCLSVISARSTSRHTTSSTTYSTLHTTVPSTFYTTTSRIITSSASSSTLAITTTSTTTSTRSPVPNVAQYGQCGGQGRLSCFWFSSLANSFNRLYCHGEGLSEGWYICHNKQMPLWHITFATFTGGTICPIDWICTVANEFFCQCLPGPNYTFPPTPTSSSTTTSPYPIQTWDYVFPL
jgi:hypothetical protein